LHIEIRLAQASDIDALTALLIQLGYGVTSDQVRRAVIARVVDYDPVYVATSNGTVVGVIALHIARWIQLDKPIARITAMIVDSQFQRRGIGRRLLDRALEHARQQDCGTIELTTANERDDAHAFYRDLGFEQTSIRFKKALR
jgi:ribosomal protein S18 acetylase RimI-like enzyme